MKTSEEIKQLIKLVAVYARVSTARQEEDGTIETQLAAVRDFAGKNGYNIVQEYIDEGWSGDILARPQLDQLRQDVKQKVWEAVLMYDPDRLARRYSYQELVTDELREAGVEVLFVTMPSPKNGEEKILHGVRGLFAEYERVKITERFRLGKLRKVREGHILVTEAPYGLTYIPNKNGEHGYYEINDAEIKNLKKIFSLVDEGLTLRGVVNKLQELGIQPRKSKRGVWSTSTLSKLLRNRTYIGEACYGKSYAVVPENPIKTEKYKKIRKTSRRNKPESEWTIIPVPAILDKNLFDRVQERLKTNFALCERARKNDYLLSSKTWCTCGCRRTGEGPQHGKYLYYRCTNKVHTFPFPPTCKEKGIDARIADKLVWQKISKLMSSPELLTQQINRWLKQRPDKRQDTEIALEDMQKDIWKFKEQEDRYNKAYGAGLLTLESLREYVIPIRERVTAIEKQIGEGKVKREGINEAVLPKFNEIKIFAEQVKKTLKDLNFEAKQAIVTDVIDKIIGSPKELQVYGFIPVSNINNYVGHKTIHRYRGSP